MAGKKSEHSANMVQLNDQTPPLSTQSTIAPEKEERYHVLAHREKYAYVPFYTATAMDF